MVEPRKKRALVVDDSATARVTLRRMLEKHDLIVDAAQSAEDALGYLADARPDVIFMDHNMPGMDGLQAVRVIKDDPSTAMIPIMMYTSMAGEVYVGEARALGAVGVLSKEVKPVHLLKVLRALHLVEDPEDPNASGIRRAKATFVELDRPAAPLADELRGAVKEAVASYEHEALRELMHRLLTEQHGQIKKDLEAGLARLEKRLGGRLDQVDWVAEQLSEQRGRSRLGLLLQGAAVALIVVLAARSYPGGAPAPEAARHQAAVAAPPAGLPGAAVAEPGHAPGTTGDEGIYDLVGWALSEDARYPFTGMALGAETLDRLRGLLPRLAGVGYVGELELHTHVGQFCVTRNAFGELTLADAQVPVTECELWPASAEEALQLGEQRSVAFANFLAADPELTQGRIGLRVVTHGLGDHPGEGGIQADTAGEWNRFALDRNRVEFRLLPAAARAGDI